VAIYELHYNISQQVNKETPSVPPNRYCQVDNQSGTLKEKQIARWDTRQTIFASLLALNKEKGDSKWIRGHK
jgi:hypothetical protein